VNLSKARHRAGFVVSGCRSGVRGRTDFSGKGDRQITGANYLTNIPGVGAILL